MQTFLREYRRPPSALAYMARAFAPSPGLQPEGRSLGLALRWRGVHIDPVHWDRYAGLVGGTPAGQQLVYPHVLGFRLVMALLTHPAFPLPIWQALQIRNHLQLHDALPMDEPLDLEATLAAQRPVEKGVELDVRTGLFRQDVPVWDSVITFFYRGRHGAAQSPSPLARSPDPPQSEVARWHMPAGPGYAFGRLTGDYNGIHLWSAYARRFGFPGAFHHPQLVLGQCLARLPVPAGPAQRLDAWLKGPVFYGRDVALYSRNVAGGVEFALRMDGEPRACIVGRWVAPPSSQLRNPRATPSVPWQSPARASRTARWPAP